MTEEVAKLKAATSTIATYVKFLESELRSARQELERVYSQRATDLPPSGVQTGLTTRLRAMLAKRPMTRAEIHEILDSEGFPYRRRNLGVTLAQAFEHVPDPGKRTGGRWTLRGPA